MGLKQLNLPARLARDERGKIDDIFKSLCEAGKCVLRYFNVSELGIEGSPLVSGPVDVSSETIIAGPEESLMEGPLRESVRRGPMVCVETPGQSLVQGFHNPVAVVVFEDAEKEVVALVDYVQSNTIEIRWSWGDPNGYVEKLVCSLVRTRDRADETPTTTTSKCIDASRDPYGKFREGNTLKVNEDRPPETVEADSAVDRLRESSVFKIPDDIELRDYQKDAIRAWSRAGGMGIWAMATGTGKTITALTLAAKIAEKNIPLVVIVVCPFLNLCRQWVGEMSKFGLRPLTCFGGSGEWLPRFEGIYQRLNVGLSTVESIVTTNKTFQSRAFQACLGPHVSGIARHHHLLIADEVHNLGSRVSSRILPDGIKMRLGLSATPERHLDPEGTAAIISYFGGVVYEYGLSRAIAEGHLCRYRYHPLLVRLTEEEAESYGEISAQLGRLLHDAEENPEIGQTAMRLLIKRARLLAGAENKILVLDELLKSLPEKPSKAIFYCGDGTTTDRISDDEIRQIQAVARLLGERHDLRVRNFTYRESASEREEILRDLGTGFLDAVVAIRCLDEGIDLPDLRMGFLLASSTNPRQFVQRRGRLLRKAEGKKFAEIYDFIIAPPEPDPDQDAASFNVERSLLRRELKRIEEFCNMADNGSEAQLELQNIRNSFNLLAG